MKKIAITILISVMALMISGAAAGMLIPAAEPAMEKAQAPNNSPVINWENSEWELTPPTPYYVNSHNPTLKALFGVRHEFDGAFSAELNPTELGLLELIGVKTEPVQMYQVTARPVCGDGKIHKKEQCGEPGLGECPTGYVCESCKCVEETAPSERLCYPDAQTPWGIVKTNGGSGGAGIKVAVLDTGVYKEHMDLKDNIVDCKDATKRKIRNGCADGNGHGTHVSGTILANGGADSQGIYGIAPEAKLMAIKVCGNSGLCPGDYIAAGIRYAADKGANIISMSLGGNLPDPEISSAVDYAVGNGVLVVAAAGNDGPADGSIDYPAAYAKVIAAGAIDINEAVPSWSSRGINDGDYVIEEKEVELGAPGVSVESTYKNGCYAYGSGTSMATPHISGLAAKLWQGNAATTRIYIQNIARDIWETGDDTATGFGLPVAP